MIELFEELHILASKQQFDELISDLETRVTAPWEYRFAGVSTQISGLRTVAFNYRGGPLPDANLSLAWHEGEITLGNIVPNTFGQLTRGEYNQLFRDFYGKFLQPAAVALRLHPTVTPGERDISEWLGKNALLLLRQFSGAANKGSGASHPLDRDRWLDFIIAVHMEGASLPSDVLRQWLVEEERWPETIAQDLASDYFDALELLERYDDQK